MATAPELTWAHTAPSAEEYLALRAACGLTPRSPAGAERALPQSLFIVTARAPGRSTGGATRGARSGGAPAGTDDGKPAAPDAHSASADALDLVAMGRVVGDGGCFFQVVDIMVHPDFQGRGLGVEVMRRIMAYLTEAADETAHINLFAAPKATRLYERFGFARSEPVCIGMDLPRPHESPRPAPGLRAFKELDMRVGTVTGAEEFPEAHTPAYKLTIDFGDHALRSSARITDLYAPEELVGRQVITAVNLGERQIGPFISQCLVLGIEAADGSVVLLEPERPVPPGGRVS